MKQEIKLVKMNPYGKEFEKFVEEQRPIAVGYLVGVKSVPEEDAEDIYQEACTALFQNLLEGKVREIAQLSTYLLQICLNTTGKYFRKKEQMKKTETNDDEESAKELEMLMNMAYNEDTLEVNYSDEKINKLLDILEEGEEPGFIANLLDQVEGIVAHLPHPCNRLLWMRYWDKLSHKEVAGIMKYASANVSKTETSRCLARFKNKIYELIKR